ncbi:alpha/beta hydrolase fold protein [Thiorhodococcus drewsii AZ1]|uniref:Alpha/beta hydrolase fold protein n=1 Tax=Thiorhodococcus drewsii AZ1 TaxID=765913 RepID=G2E2Q8_9GAMM|nr:alpha/beta hydrolase [Thiorhodococcus drewsii]EGV30612.1 alpha/beta hydrolase fold protein [Thiorhodococcus drewsii AZ1]
MPHIVTDHAIIRGSRIAHGVHGSGEPVVLLHGTPASSFIWRNIMPRLVEAGYRVHVFDLLGYGLSERPWDPAIDTSISAQVPILEGMLAHWGLDSAHVVGHDFGGGIAQRFGIFSPERLRSLTLIDAVSFDSYPSPRTREQMAAGLDTLSKRPDAEHRAHFSAWLRDAAHHREHFASEALDTYLDLISGPVGQASLFQHQVAHYDPKHTLEIASRLAELSAVPVQILWGENDPWQVVDWAHRLHAAIPGSVLHLIPECGHFAMEDQPDAIGRLLVHFLEAGVTFQ